MSQSATQCTGTQSMCVSDAVCAMQGWSAAAATRPAPVAAALEAGADLASVPDASLFPPEAAPGLAPGTQPPLQQQRPTTLGQLAADAGAAMAPPPQGGRGTTEGPASALGAPSGDGAFSSATLTDFRFDRATILRHILV